MTNKVERAGEKEKQEAQLSRRDLLEWLGSGCVLSLSGLVLPCCSSGGCNAAVPGPSPALQEHFDLGGPESFPFQPGARIHPVYKNWGERSMERLDLQQVLKSWKLTVDGLVERPRTFTFAELVDFKRIDMKADFHCVEGWSIYDVPWSGLHLSQLFSRVKPKKGASHVTFHTIGDIYNESLPLDIALEQSTLLAYGLAGSTLPFKHGFPLRIVIPRLLGYKNAKYVYRVQLTDAAVKGYWVARGYPYGGFVPAHRLRPRRY